MKAREIQKKLKNYETFSNDNCRVKWTLSGKINNFNIICVTDATKESWYILKEFGQIPEKMAASHLFFKRRKFVLFGILISIWITILSPAESSHIMTSDSREEPEFQMVYNGIETEPEKRKGTLPPVDELVGESLPSPGPIQPPIPTFRNHQHFHHKENVVLDEVRRALAGGHRV